jgi:hypothetical protein
LRRISTTAAVSGNSLHSRHTNARGLR